MDWVSFWCGFVAAFVGSGLFTVIIAQVLFRSSQREDEDCSQNWWRGNPLNKKRSD